MTPIQKAAIIKHGEQLNAIFNTGFNPVTLCKKLRRIEGAAHKLAADVCNYLSMESEAFYKREQAIKNRVYGILFPRSVMGTNDTLHYNGIFINFDPRGYALKIDSEYMSSHNLKLHTDMGGYGILAPEINKEGE